LSGSEAIINLSNVYFKRNKKLILKNINWQVLNGEKWVIIGENGSGKTTLLSLISGYLWPSSGKINVLGRSFGRTDLRELRKNIGFVSPDFIERIPPNDTFIEVLLSGRFASFGLYDKPSDEDMEYAEKIIAFMKAENMKNRKFHKLSRGEKQRCLIGRALMSNPSLLLLDEPNEGLDLPSREKLLSLIKKLALERDDLTIIMTTHHIEEIPNGFTRLLALKHGEIFFKGNINEILTEKKISRLFDYDLTIKKNGERYFAFYSQQSME